jgi:hypothetical protein
MISAEVEGSPFFGLLPNHGLGADGGGVGVDGGCVGIVGGVCACSEDWPFFFLAIT